LGNYRLELESVSRIRALPDRTEIVGRGGIYHLPVGARDLHILAPGLSRPHSRPPVALFLRLPAPARCSIEEKEGRYTLILSSVPEAEREASEGTGEEAGAHILPPPASL
jgi:hypothetical protein